MNYCMAVGIFVGTLSLLWSAGPHSPPQSRSEPVSIKGRLLEPEGKRIIDRHVGIDSIDRCNDRGGFPIAGRSDGGDRRGVRTQAVDPCKAAADHQFVVNGLLVQETEGGRIRYSRGSTLCGRRLIPASHRFRKTRPRTKKPPALRGIEQAYSSHHQLSVSLTGPKSLPSRAPKKASQSRSCSSVPGSTAS